MSSVNGNAIRRFFSSSHRAELFAGVSAGFVVIAALYSLQSLTSAVRHTPRIKPDLSHDPKLNSKILLPKLDVLGRDVAPESDGRTMLVEVGGCTECSLKAFRPERFDSTIFARVILVFDNPASELRTKAKRFANVYRLVSDERGELRRQLNAVYTPRFYEIGTRSELKWIQTDPDISPEGYR